MINLIKKYQEAYYAGTPLISDEQYDALVEHYGDSEETIGPKGDIPHLNPMYSLQKFYPCRGDSLPSTSGMIKTRKLDGAAIELVYEKVAGDLFVLKHLCTRGDVDAGKLIPHVRHAHLKIPSAIEYETDHNFLQVKGEVVSSSNIENARNMASGKLQLDSNDEFAAAVSELGLMFFAYSVEAENQGLITTKYETDLNFLSDKGFYTVDKVDELLSTKPTLNLNFDGEVYRLNDNAAFLEAGFTAKFPRAAFAVKEDRDFVVSTLLDVEWKTGRTGKVVPKAIIEPVMIEGARVSRATLNNPKFIEAMGLYKGCKVKIIRSGEIIPCIIGLYEDS